MPTAAGAGRAAAGVPRRATRTPAARASLEEGATEQGERAVPCGSTGAKRATGRAASSTAAGPAAGAAAVASAAAAAASKTAANTQREAERGTREAAALPAGEAEARVATAARGKTASRGDVETTTAEEVLGTAAGKQRKMKTPLETASPSFRSGVRGKSSRAVRSAVTGGTSQGLHSAAASSACCARLRAGTKKQEEELEKPMNFDSKAATAAAVACKKEVKSPTEETGGAAARATHDVEEKQKRTTAITEEDSPIMSCCSTSRQPHLYVPVKTTSAATRVAAATPPDAVAAPDAAAGSDAATPAEVAAGSDAAATASDAAAAAAASEAAAGSGAAAAAAASEAAAVAPNAAAAAPDAAAAAAAADAANCSAAAGSPVLAPCAGDDLVFVRELLREDLCGDAFLFARSDAAAGLPPSSSSSSWASAFCAARAAAAATAGRRAQRAAAAVLSAAAAQSVAASGPTEAAAAAPDLSAKVNTFSKPSTAAAAGVLSEQTSSRPSEENSSRSMIAKFVDGRSSSSSSTCTCSSRGLYSSSRGEARGRDVPVCPACTDGKKKKTHFLGNSLVDGRHDYRDVLQHILEEVVGGRPAARCSASSAVAATSCAGAPPSTVAAGVTAAGGGLPAASAQPAAPAAARVTTRIEEDSGTAADTAKSSSSRRKSGGKQLLHEYAYRITRRVLLNATERMLLVGTVNFLVVLGLSLGLSVRCISVACVYLHRFFDVFSFQQLERKIAASAALLLAWKYAEDTEVNTRNTRKLYDLARGIYRVVMQQKAADLRAIREQLLLLTRSKEGNSSAGVDTSKASASSVEDAAHSTSSQNISGGRSEIKEEVVAAAVQDRGHHDAGGDANSVSRASVSMPGSSPSLHLAAAAAPVSAPPLTNHLSGVSASHAGPCLTTSSHYFSPATPESCVTAGACALAATCTPPAPCTPAAACAPPAAAACAEVAPGRRAVGAVPAETAGEGSVVGRCAAAAFSVLLAEEVIADVVSSSRWLLRDEGASFRSLCQKLRVYEAAVLRGIRFDVCPSFFPLPAIRLYVKLFLLKCCWCCPAAQPVSLAGADDSCLVTSETSHCCRATIEPTHPCHCAPAAELPLSPSSCSCAALVKSTASCCCSSSDKPSSSSCCSWIHNRDSARFPSSAASAGATGNVSASSCCCSTACRCCCFSTQRPTGWTRCCCSAWPAAGLSYVQLQRRLHAEALRQLLFLCRTPFVIERQPNDIAAACIVKAAIECGLPFLMSAQQQIKLATATWHQLHDQRSSPRAAVLQQTKRHLQQFKAQQEFTKAKHEVEEQPNMSYAAEETLPPLLNQHIHEKDNINTSKGIGQRAALLALESFDRHVTHFMHSINHPYGSYGSVHGCCKDCAATAGAVTAQHTRGAAATRCTSSKASVAVDKASDVVYNVDPGQVKRVLAEMRLASRWMAELLWVTGAAATSLVEPISKGGRNKRARRMEFDGTHTSRFCGPPCAESSAAAGAHIVAFDKGYNGAAAGCDGSRAAAPAALLIPTIAAVHTPQSAALCPLVGTAAGCDAEALPVVDAVDDAPASASGPATETGACSVKDLVLHEIGKPRCKQEQAVQQKRLKRCMEYIRNVLGKRPSDDEHYSAPALQETEANQSVPQTIDGEELPQLHAPKQNKHTPHVKGNDKFTSVY